MEALKNKKASYKQLRSSFFFNFILKTRIHSPAQARNIHTGQQPENS